MRALLLRCGDRPLAVPATAVRHVAPAGPTMALPRVPDWVEGAAAYGREVVPQIALGRLLGLPETGAIAVVAASGAGPVALRVTAAERVAEGEAVAAPQESTPVGAGFRHHGVTMPLLDLDRLAWPVQPATPVRLAAAAPAGVTGASGSPAAEEAAAGFLLCLAGGRRLRLPRAEVVAIERAADGVVLLDLASERPAGTLPALCVTMEAPAGRCAVGVDAVAGFVGETDDEAVDVAALLRSGAPTPPARQAIAAERRMVPLLLVRVGGREVLLPRAKAVRVGRIERWRDLPPTDGGAASIALVGAELLPVLDLGGLLGEAPGRRTLAVAVETRGQRWALACDRVSERRAVVVGRPETVALLPGLGEASVAEGLLPVLDLDRLPLPEHEA